MPSADFCSKSVVQACTALPTCLPACRARAHDPTKFVVSPITGELIPVDQMSEHMRVSMIDPRFQEQRNAMLAKIRDTTKAGDDEISRNLMTLAKKRPDVFGELSGWQRNLCHLPEGAAAWVRLLLTYCRCRDGYLAIRHAISCLAGTSW